MRKSCVRTPEEMPLKSSETTDGRVIGRGEWSPTSRRHTYITPSIWRVIPSGVLKKLRNTLSDCKPTFDSIYRYRQSHHLSTERLDCLLHSWRQQTGVHRRLRHCWKWHYETESLMTLMSTMGSKGLIAFCEASCILYACTSYMYIKISAFVSLKHT